jgi:hypothetical protein
MAEGAFVERVTMASEGNFLYLKWLLPAIAAGAQRFARLDALPQGLAGIYREFLSTRKMAKDEAWRQRYRSLLGVLAAAQAPLALEQVAQFGGLPLQMADDGLRDLRQFLDPATAEKGSYQLYHQSVADWLSSREGAGRFWIDMTSVHAQIGACYLEHYAGRWAECDDYGLQYTATHLAKARRWHELCQLLDRDFMNAKRHRYGAHHSFIGDIRILTAALPKDLQWFPKLAKVVYLSALLGNFTENVPDNILHLLVQLGGPYRQRALYLVEMMQDARRRANIYGHLAGGLRPGGYRTRFHEPRDAELLYRALAAIELMPDSHAQKILYREIAPDLARAGELETAIEVISRLSDYPEWYEMDMVDVAKATGVSGNLPVAWDLLKSVSGDDLHKNLHEMVEDIANSRTPGTIRSAFEFLASLEDAELCISQVSSLCHTLGCRTEWVESREEELRRCDGAGRRMLIDEISAQVDEALRHPRDQSEHDRGVLYSQQLHVWAWTGRYHLIRDELINHPGWPTSSPFLRYPLTEWQTPVDWWIYDDYIALDMDQDLQLLSAVLSPGYGAERALEKWEEWRGDTPDEELLTHFVERLSALQELDHQKRDQEQDYNTRMVSIAAVKIVKAGQSEELLDAIRDLDGAVWVVERLARAGLFDEAIEIAKVVTLGDIDELDRKKAAQDIVAALVGHGQKTRIVSALRELFESPSDRCEVLADVARKIRVVEPDTAGELLEMALDLTEVIEGNPLVVYWAHFALQLAEAGRLQEALWVLHKTRPGRRGSQFSPSWAEAMSVTIQRIKGTDSARAAAELAKAIRLVLDLPCRHPGVASRAENLATFALYLAKCELLDEALRVAKLARSYEVSNPYLSEVLSFITENDDDQTGHSRSSLLDMQAVYEHLADSPSDLFDFSGRGDMRYMVFLVSIGQIEKARALAEEVEKRRAAQAPRISADEVRRVVNGVAASACFPASDEPAIPAPPMLLARDLDEENDPRPKAHEVQSGGPSPEGGLETETGAREGEPEDDLGRVEPSMGANAAEDQPRERGGDAPADVLEPWRRTLEAIYVDGVLEPDTSLKVGDEAQRVRLCALASGCAAYMQLEALRLSHHAQLMVPSLWALFRSLFEDNARPRFAPIVSWRFGLPETEQLDEITDADLARPVFAVISLVAAQMGVYADFEALSRHALPSGEPGREMLDVAEQLARKGRFCQALSAAGNIPSELIDDTIKYTVLGTLRLAARGQAVGLQALLLRILPGDLSDLEDLVRVVPPDSIDKEIERLGNLLGAPHSLHPGEALQQLIAFASLKSLGQVLQPELVWQVAQELVEVDSWWD